MVSGLIQGGAANVMFQISAIYAFAMKYNMDYVIPIANSSPHLGQKSTTFPNVKYSDKIPELPIYLEPHFQYTEIPYMPDIFMHGYWQSFLYHYEYKKEILELLGFEDIITNEGVVSLHIRRQDYLKFPTIHPVVTMDYIKKALGVFLNKGDYSFQIHSDDLMWCKENLTDDIFEGHDYEFVPNGDELTDLKYMAMAEHNITANSAFSLWAAYINPNPQKIVVSPRKWFGKDLAHDTKDLYLPNSIIL